jgi:peptidyl-prolyl cis-trans isomerase SurA
MSSWRIVREGNERRRMCAWILAVSLGCAGAGQAMAQAAQPEILDRVVAVVNNQAILSSDLDDDIQLSVLDPSRGGQGVLTRQQALEQLISRTLIQQQIRQEDEQAIEPSQADVSARLEQIRKDLPACVRENCASDSGWAKFLTAHDLTAEEVKAYMRNRMEILNFIVTRFQQGIRISPEEIADYYNKTLLPQYPAGEIVPPLKEVAPRIEEILLQQQVNALFDDWLKNLREQGDIEVLDPTHATEATGAGAGKGSK